MDNTIPAEVFADLVNTAMEELFDASGPQETRTLAGWMKELRGLVGEAADEDLDDDIEEDE